MSKRTPTISEEWAEEMAFLYGTDAQGRLLPEAPPGQSFFDRVQARMQRKAAAEQEEE